MKRYMLLVPCLLILAAVALSACGGGGGSDDEGKIEEAIETAATTSNPSNCTELETQKFDEQNTSVEGAAAVKECEKEAKNGEDEPAESVDIANVSVNGETATAEVALSGGALNGQSLEVALEKEGDNWKLDEIVGFTNFDGAKLAETLEEKFTEEGDVPPKMASCIVKAFAQASQAEAEELLFSGNLEAVEEVALKCQ